MRSRNEGCSSTEDLLDVRSSCCAHMRACQRYFRSGVASVTRQTHPIVALRTQTWVIGIRNVSAVASFSEPAQCGVWMRFRLPDQQAERVPSRIGQHVERFALVPRTVIQQPSTQFFRSFAMPLEVLDRGYLPGGSSPFR